MKGVFILVLVCLAASESFADDRLECYQCSPVTAECEISNAESIKCGTISSSRCSKQIKKGSTDVHKAIRKCVIPEVGGEIPCPNGYDCYNCDTDLCNAGSALKFTWASLIAVFFSVLYSMY